jgi:hypothetical protein
VNVRRAPDGDIWTVVTSGSYNWVLAPLGVLGAFALVYSARMVPHGSQSAWGMLGGAAVLGAGGVTAGLRRTGLTLDRAKKSVEIWQWLIIRRQRTVSAAGKSIWVERDEDRATDGTTTDIGRVRLGDELLATKTLEIATELGPRLATFMAIPYGGEKQSRSMRKRRAAEARYALLPLLLTGVVLLVGLIILFGQLRW